jgi:uncharacterized protein
VNTASAALLSRVSGLSATVAENIVRHRDDNGPFKRRKDLLKVARLGDKTFEQCAGFLRIADGDQPLDASAVHPEAYPVVERIVASTARPIKALIGDGSFLRGLKAEQFTDDTFGVPTVRDILKELESRAATRARSSRRRASPRASRTSRTCARAWCWKAWSATWPPSAPSSISACTRTA